MALDHSLAMSQSDPSIPRMDYSSHINVGNPQGPGFPPSSTSPSIATSSSSTSFMDSPTSIDAANAQTSSSPTPESNGAIANDLDTSASTGNQILDVDPQILEALKSKDRIYVLKLGETFEALIKERRIRVELTPATSYQRLLVHRCSAYYRLAPESDPVTKAIFVLTTTDSRIPDRRICELVPAESSTQPAFKIMRRSALERRSKPQSHAGSVAGEDADLSDVEPSESGSLGGRSNVTSSSTKKRMTIEEREAAYNEARSRIFMGFEEKEKSKDKDMSASSSSLSVSGSTSTSAGCRSSLGDTDDAISSPATESEWSTPSGSNSRDKKDGRRGGPAGASASSSRSLRNGGSFYADGSSSGSRNSRAPSPSFTYATLYEPPPSGQIYDPSQGHGPNLGYHPNHFAYPYSPPTQGPSPPFLPPYPYYAPHYNPYQPPQPMPQHNPADPSTPSGPDPYSPPHQMNYGPPYGWPPHPNQPPLQSPPNSMHLPLPQQQQLQQNPMGAMPPPPPHSPPYPPYNMHPPHAYTYPMNAYYPPPPPPPGQQQQMAPSPPVRVNMQQQHHSYDVPRSMNGNSMGHPPAGQFNNHNGNGPRNGLGNGVIPPNINGRTMSRNSVGHGVGNNGNSVNGGRHPVPMPPSGRSAWSYGPGVGMGGYTTSVSSAGGDAMGPRLNPDRRSSGANSSGGNSRSSSNCDEVSSTASSSTTSSSSRRTFTSTASSQHPLPPRPDWAVGLKAQPTLAAMSGRHHDHSVTNSRTMSPISPPRSNGQNSPHSNGNSPRQQANSQHTPPVSLQANDFPPLTPCAPVQEKRPLVVSGAWGSSRPILAPANGNANTPGNTGSGANSPNLKQEDGEGGGSERPAGKSGELYNPKLVRRPPAVNGQGYQRGPGDRSKDPLAAPAKMDSPAGANALVGQMASVSLEDENGVDVGASMPSSRDRELLVVAALQ